MVGQTRQGGSYGSRTRLRQHALGFLRACGFGFLALLSMSSTHAAAAGRTVKLVALGDSLTAGFGLPQADAFPVVLQAALKARGQDVEIANAGVSGDTSSGGLDRLAWSVPDGTDGVILELGANDMLRGTDPGVTRKALDGIISGLKTRGIPVLLAGMYAARNLGPDYVKTFDAIYPDLAHEYGLVLYPFFMDGVGGVPKLTQSDGLHPTAEGVRTIVQGILPSVESFLTRLKT